MYKSSAEFIATRIEDQQIGFEQPILHIVDSYSLTLQNISIVNCFIGAFGIVNLQSN